MNYEILVVDDDAIFLMLTEKYLQKINFDNVIRSFKNGKEVLEHLDSTYSDSIKYIILLDINMPIMNGWEFLDAILTKNYYEDLDIYIVTSSIDLADINKANTYNVVREFISKPLSISNLTEIKNQYFKVS